MKNWNLSLNLILALALITAATTARAEEAEEDMSLYYGRMERNARDGEMDNEVPVLKKPTILFNQKWETVEEQEPETAPEAQPEGPGFVPAKHCVTGELVSAYAYHRDCGKPVHSVCRSLGKDENGRDIVSCK